MSLLLVRGQLVGESTNSVYGTVNLKGTTGISSLEE